MANIPGRKRRRFYEHKAVVEAFAVVPPIVTGIVAAVVSMRDADKRTLGWFLLGASSWLAVSSVVKVLNALAQDREQKRSEDYEGLLGALYVLRSSVLFRAGLEEPSDGKLRVTIHRVVPPGKHGRGVEEVEQLLPYLGAPGRSAGRTFSVRSGIIGKAVREKVPFATSRESEDYEEFLRDLVRDWSYTDEDARRVSPDRRSWMAVPIFGPNQSVAAVVYLDSSERDFFGADIQEVVLAGCAGVASYINEVY